MTNGWRKYSEELTEFINKIKQIDIKSVIVDVEYTYANRNINNVSPHVYMLMDYIENFCNQNNIDYDLYDSAKYAVQNRTVEKTSNFEIESLKNKIKDFQNENLKKNITY